METYSWPTSLFSDIQSVLQKAYEYFIKEKPFLQ